jgi:response regulator of citrate/malate metabolism
MIDILIVDDARQDALLIERVLRVDCKIQNPITICSGGSDAMTLCKEIHQAGNHSLVLLDLIMAPLSGLDFLRFWRDSSCSKNSTVIMLSGLKDIKAINEGYQLGARTFILKPVTKSDVVQVLNSLNTRLTIEQDEKGYSLHWFGAESARRDPQRKSTQVMTISV